MFMTLGKQSLCTFNTPKRGGCTSPKHQNLRIPLEMQHEPQAHHRPVQEKWQHHTRNPNTLSGPNDLNTFQHGHCQEYCKSTHIGVGSKIALLRIGRPIVHFRTVTCPVISRTTLETGL